MRIILDVNPVLGAEDDASDDERVNAERCSALEFVPLFSSSFAFLDRYCTPTLRAKLSTAASSWA